MLVYNDSSRLGDNILSAAERYEQLRADTDAKLAPQRMPDQDDFVQAAARRGRPLHAAEVLRRLRRCIPSLWAQDGLPGWVGLYRSDRGATCEYMFAMPWGVLPEYSIIHVNERNVPEREERGWRTVLLRLHTARLITERQMTRAFGPPSNGVISNQFQRQIQARR